MGKERVTMTDIQILVDNGVDKIAAIRIFLDDLMYEELRDLPFDDIRELYRTAHLVGDLLLTEKLLPFLLVNKHDLSQKIWLWGKLKEQDHPLADDFWKNIVLQLTTAGPQQCAYRMITEMPLRASLKKGALEEVENMLKKSTQDIIKEQKKKKR